MYGQIHAFDVYVPDGDRYVQLNVPPTFPSPLYGRFTHNSLNYQMQTLSMRERAELLAGRRLQYPADFDMPDNARIYWFNDPTSGDRITIWNVEEGTEGAWHGLGGTVVVNTCQVQRIDSVG